MGRLPWASILCVRSFTPPSQFSLPLSSQSWGPHLALRCLCPRAIPEEEDGEEELGFQVTECSPEQLELSNSTQACGVLVDPQGPFATCHQTVAPDPFHK